MGVTFGIVLVWGFPRLEQTLSDKQTMVETYVIITLDVMKLTHSLTVLTVYNFFDHPYFEYLVVLL